MKKSILLALFLAAMPAFPACGTNPKFTAGPSCVANGDSTQLSCTASSDLPTDVLFYLGAMPPVAGVDILSHAQDTIYGYDSGYPNLGTGIDDPSGATSHTHLFTNLVPGTFNYGARIRQVVAGSACPQNEWVFSADGNSVATTAVNTGAALNMSVSLGQSPQHMYPGTNLFMQITTALRAGTLPNNGLVLAASGSSAIFGTNPGAAGPVAVHWADTEIEAQAGSVSSSTFFHDTYTKFNISNNGTEIEFTAAANAPIGQYTVTITPTCASCGTLSSAVSFTLYVDAVPVVTTGVPSSFPAIPNLSTFLTAIASGAPYNCAQDKGTTRGIRANDHTITDSACGQPNYAVVFISGSTCGQKTSWYYDALRAMWDYAEYLKDPTDPFAICRQNFKEIYDPWVLGVLGGNATGDAAFPRGQWKDYLKTGDPRSLKMIDSMYASSVFAGGAQSNGRGVGGRFQRELGSYGFQIDIFACLLDNPTKNSHTACYWADWDMDHAYGMLDETCNVGNSQIPEFFMMGLMWQSMMIYHDKLKPSDFRAPYIIKKCLDFAWNSYWNLDSSLPNQFPYSVYLSTIGKTGTNTQNAPGGGTQAGASDLSLLNMIMVGGWGWVWKYTGLSAYQANGDTIWNAAVNVGCTTANFGPTGNTYPTGNPGKQFSQCMFAFDPDVGYIRLRSTPVTTRAGSAVTMGSAVSAR